MVDIGGGRSGCRRRSSPSGPPSTSARHRREEDNEMKLIDKVTGPEDVWFAGDVRRMMAAIRFRVRVSHIIFQGEEERG